MQDTKRLESFFYLFYIGFPRSRCDLSEKLNWNLKTESIVYNACHNFSTQSNMLIHSSSSLLLKADIIFFLYSSINIIFSTESNENWKWTVNFLWLKKKLLQILENELFFEDIVNQNFKMKKKS